MSRLSPAVALSIVCLFASPAVAQWANFVDETAFRVNTNLDPNSGPSVVETNPDEKDYAWGDIDKDGDIDLIAVYKSLGTTAGRRRNVLLMNEGGVLVDRTTQYASNESGTIGVAGSSGFLDETNDRDVILADVNGDTWPDIITATTLSGDQPKFISHPRIYINRKDDPPGSGIWQGFVYDDVDRVPTMPAEPRFCSVSAGDLDGDVDIDLYFGDYQQGGARPIDLNNRLWINDGNGYFTDESTTRMTEDQRDVSFAMATAIVDMNKDGTLDVVIDDALSAPTAVSIVYNDPNNIGFFQAMPRDFVYNASPYHIAVGDLNNDTWMDIVITDDGNDRYILNTGVLDANGFATFGSSQLLQGSSPSQFGGNNLIADLDGDGFGDVLVGNVDVDLPSCNEPSKIYHNLGNVPDVTLIEQGTIGIAPADLLGVHDWAVFDIDGDLNLDIVIGTCTGTKVYGNLPLEGVRFEYPFGIPLFVQPDTPTTITIRVVATGETPLMPNSGTLFYSLDGDPFQSVAMTPMGSARYDADLPGAECATNYKFYVQVLLQNGEPFTDPFDAPASANTSIAAVGTEITLEDGIEGDVSAWTVVNDPSLTSGAWEQAEPIQTIFQGAIAAPGADAEASDDNTFAFVTQNCPPPPDPCSNFAAGTADVDGGPTDLLTPVLNLNGTDAEISYFRWAYSSGADVLTVSITNDANSPTPTWVNVENVAHTSNGQTTAWEGHSFRVSDFVAPTSTVQVRFRANDVDTGSVVEAGVDLFRVEKFLCSLVPTCACPGDVSDNGGVDGADMQGFIDCMFGGGANCICADIDPGLGLDTADIAAFVTAILSGPACQ
jgi:hypothetical protein